MEAVRKNGQLHLQEVDLRHFAHRAAPKMLPLGSQRVDKPHRTYRNCVGVVLCCLAAAGVGSNSVFAQANPATIYHNGDILTMEGDQPRYVEALVEQGGDIAFVGSLSTALQKYPKSRREDLHHRTLVPGFIDGHGHVYSTGFASLFANLRSMPDGPVNDFASLVKAGRAWAMSADGKSFIQNFGWIIGNGYDESQLREGEAPTADTLDAISTEVPVLVIHQSGHVGSLNHKALELAGYRSDTADPPGGVIRRDVHGSPTGVVEEGALIPIIAKLMGSAGPALEDLSISAGQAAYASGGYTTAQEGRALPNMTKALERAADAGKLYLDVVSYPDGNMNLAAMQSPYNLKDHAYRQHYRIGGVKISLDGSPQAKTAWLSQPYFVPPAHQHEEYRGYPAMPDAQAFAVFDAAAKNNWQILCHANGDAAIEQCISGAAHAQERFGSKDRRTVIIHAQTIRRDQLARLGSLHIVPSFFAAHTYYWGDFHRDSVLGPSRASYISPTRDALKFGLTLTSHHDAPVIPPNAMRVLDGLKALTSWAAIQYVEDNEKGTLSPGRNADFAILSDNPLKVAPVNIHKIEVLRTIKDGRIVYQKAKFQNRK